MARDFHDLAEWRHRSASRLIPGALEGEAGHIIEDAISRVTKVPDSVPYPTHNDVACAPKSALDICQDAGTHMK